MAARDGVRGGKAYFYTPVEVRKFATDRTYEEKALIMRIADETTTATQTYTQEIREIVHETSCWQELLGELRAYLIQEIL